MSKFITLWIGCLLGLMFPMFAGLPPVLFCGRTAAGFIFVSVVAYALHRFRMRGTADMVLVAIVAEAWVFIVWKGFLDRRELLAMTLCMMVPWLVGLTVSLASSAPSPRSRGGD